MQSEQPYAHCIDEYESTFCPSHFSLDSSHGVSRFSPGSHVLVPTFCYFAFQNGPRSFVSFRFVYLSACKHRMYGSRGPVLRPVCPSIEACRKVNILLVSQRPRLLAVLSRRSPAPGHLRSACFTMLTGHRHPLYGTPYPGLRLLAGPRPEMQDTAWLLRSGNAPNSPSCHPPILESPQAESRGLPPQTGHNRNKSFFFPVGSSPGGSSGPCGFAKTSKRRKPSPAWRVQASSCQRKSRCPVLPFGAVRSARTGGTMHGGKK